MGDYIYVFGGADTQPDLRVESALIKPDGSINPFAGAFGSNATSRTQTKVQLIKSYVYLIGGHDIPSGATSKSPERALLNGSGGLRPFELASSVVMNTESPSIMRVGEYLYALGISGKLERAKIDAHDNAAPPLDTFTAVTGITVTEHAAAATAVTGNYLHVVGGTAGRVYKTTTARAELR